MAMVDDRRSRLNPNAPVFVPNASFSEVEDFSPEWWDLVKTSPWFRDYWLSENQEDDFNISFEGDDDWSELEFPGTDDSAQFVKSEEKIESAPKKGTEPVNVITGLNNGMDAKALLKNLNVNVSKSPRGRGPISPVGPSKYCEKKLASKCVMNPKCSAIGRIHQPR